MQKNIPLITRKGIVTKRTLIIYENEIRSKWSENVHFQPCLSHEVALTYVKNVTYQTWRKTFPQSLV